LNYAFAENGTAAVGFHQAHNATDVTGFHVGAKTAANLTQDQESSTLYGSVNLQAHAQATGDADRSVSELPVFNGGGADSLTDRFYLVGLNFAYQFTHISLVNLAII